MMGSEPLEEEIPLERTDLLMDTQLAFSVYDKLQSNWEGFSGSYLGKDLSILPSLMEDYQIPLESRKYIWEVIPVIDHYVGKDIARKIKQGKNSGNSNS